MIKVVFVGDEPSVHNFFPDLAFVGTRSFTTLVGWIKEIDPDYYVLINSNTTVDRARIEILYKKGFRVIALGKKASDRMKNCGIKHLKLPHPSGLNRKLNNKHYVEMEIDHVKMILREKDFEFFADLLMKDKT